MYMSVWNECRIRFNYYSYIVVKYYARNGILYVLIKTKKTGNKKVTDFESVEYKK